MVKFEKLQFVKEMIKTTGCLLDYNYFKNYYKMAAIDLSEQQALDADQKAIQQINFTGNLAGNPVANTTIFFIIEEAKETKEATKISQVTLKVLQFYFVLIKYQYKMTQYYCKKQIKKSLEVKKE